MERRNVGILGATGAVGQRFIQLLSNHPWFEITWLAASDRSAGKTYAEACNWRLDTPLPEHIANMVLQPNTPTGSGIKLPRIIFSSVDSDIAKELEPLFAAAGCAVISNSSAFRMGADVPLVVPEVNADHLEVIEQQATRRGRNGNQPSGGFLVTNPNCCAIGLVLPLAALEQKFGIEKLFVSTMQAVSGAGYPGVASLDILGNVIPYIKNEEEKLQEEVAKLLGGVLTEGGFAPGDMTVSAMCHRVPVIDGHTEAVSVKLKKKATYEEIVAAWAEFQPLSGKGHKGLHLPSAPLQPVVYQTAVDRPQPRLDLAAGNGMTTTVGRLRLHPLRLEVHPPQPQHHPRRCRRSYPQRRNPRRSRQVRLQQFSYGQRSCRTAGTRMSTPRNHIVVMKFGGTSVEDAPAMLRTAGIVQGRIRKGLSPVVAVSAMAKVTDTLLAAAAAAGNNDREEALKLSDGLRTRHLGVAEELVSGDALTSLQINLHHDFDALDEMLRGICAVGELTLRSTDNIVSFGERLSSQMVTAAFAAKGMNSAHVDARTVILTDNHYGKAAPDEAKIGPALEANILPLIDAGKVPVMGGFIGSCNGITTTLGRGGSDYTAALVGGGLHAGAIEIWTDVNGIMTTDPRIVPEALRVKTISFEEAAELAYFGAKVLHPATILPAVQKNIPVWVLNSRNPENEGTVITATPPACASPFKSIAAKKKLTIIDIVASRMLLAHGFLKIVFDVFDKYGCAIDMVSTSEVSISVTVDSRESLPEICEELSKIADVKLEGSKALICLVGEDIRGHAGIAGQVFSAVSHINVRMISQGASEINMSFMIDESDVEDAVRSLHRKFFASADPTIFDVKAIAAVR